MEAFRTEDGTVAKFIHADGSETAIKTVLSQSTFVNADTGEISHAYTDRNKASIFVSSSVGCRLRCPFCHLTLKNSVYRPLSSESVLANLLEATAAEIETHPELSERFFKVCWMGMGDALSDPDMIRDVTLAYLDALLRKGWAKGLDSVDISSVIPRVDPSWVDILAQLNKELARFPTNPSRHRVEQAEFATHDRYATRSLLRFFYSLHGVRHETRKRMAPGTLPLDQAVSLLHDLRSRGVSVLMHQVFLENINDHQDDIDALVSFMNREFPDTELRILRYNQCDRGPYREGNHAIDRISRSLVKPGQLKIQISAGKEVQAACGQFLVSMVRPVTKNTAG